MNLNVVSCSESEKIPEEEENNAAEDELKGAEQAMNDAAPEDSNETVSEAIPVLQPDTSEELPLTKRPGFWAAIIAINIIVLAGIAFFASSLSKK